MEPNIAPGRYVIAVSGGVDSMVLLDLLTKQPGIVLVVAHFNHGIRRESTKDEELVAAKAKQLKLPFEVGYGHLGKAASEEAARKARYEFLEGVRKKYKADGIITAHHQDDLIETAFLNILRGTGHKGLSAISSNKRVIRPLLGYSKSEILTYAEANQVKWQEDSTNQEETHLRNYLRNKILTGLSTEQRRLLICNIDKVAKKSVILENQIAKISHNIYSESVVARDKFIALPVDLGNELIAHWLRDFDTADYDKRTINRLSVALRTSKAGTIHPVKGNLSIKIDQKKASFTHTL